MLLISSKFREGAGGLGGTCESHSLKGREIIDIPSSIPIPSSVATTADRRSVIGVGGGLLGSVDKTDTLLKVLSVEDGDKLLPYGSR